MIFFEKKLNKEQGEVAKEKIIIIIKKEKIYHRHGGRGHDFQEQDQLIWPQFISAQLNHRF